MTIFHKMEEFAIKCEPGHILIEAARTGDKFWEAKSLIKSDWFQCEIFFDCSVERAIEFSRELNSMLVAGEGLVNFINEDGNFDLDINLNIQGQVKINGCVCKSMADKSLIKFELNSGMVDLENFLRNFESYFA